MKQGRVVLGFIVTLSVAVPAQSPEPPIANTRLTVNTLVREDIFAGFLRNDLVRLARAEKNLELLLASRPVDRPALLAWQGSAALTRAALANEANQPEQFRQHYGRALDLFAEAMSLGPDVGRGICHHGRFTDVTGRPVARGGTRGRLGAGLPRLPTVVEAARTRDRAATGPSQGRSAVWAHAERAAHRTRRGGRRAARPDTGASSGYAVRESRAAMEGRPLGAHGDEADVPDLSRTWDARRTSRRSFAVDGRWRGWWIAMLGADAVFCDGLLGAMLFSDREIGEAVHHPLWTPDGSRLFYFQGASNAVAVDITTGARRWRYGSVFGGRPRRRPMVRPQSAAVSLIPCVTDRSSLPCSPPNSSAI